MAITEIRPAVCMACGHKQSVLDVRQINVQKRPEIKQKILQGTLFPMHCRACGAVLEKAQNCLYIDPALPLLLELAAPGEPCRLQEVQEGLGDTKAIIRVVRTPEDMAEKLRIFDCGLDDRVVEIVRLLMVTQLTEQTPDLLESSPVFSAPHGEPQLTCLCHDGSERVCPITRKLQSEIYTQYLADREAQDTLVVDSAWVYRLLLSQKGRA